MKRFALLLLMLAVLSSLSSPLHASSPVISNGTVSITALFSRYFPFFLRTLTEVEPPQLMPSEDANVPVVGGDPDDYANGRMGPGTNGGSLIIGPSIPGKSIYN